MKIYDWTLYLHDRDGKFSVSRVIRNGKNFAPNYSRLIMLAHCNSNNENTIKALPNSIRV